VDGQFGSGTGVGRLPGLKTPDLEPSSLSHLTECAADSPTPIEEVRWALFSRASKSAGLIVIEVRNGRRNRVGRDFDAEAFGGVLDVLERR
jgi:hypothetical protein